MSGYLQYFAERFVIFVATIFVAITVVFFIPRLVPGDPMGAVFLNLAAVGASAGATELVEEYRQIFGLDRGLWEQYIRFLTEIAQGNLGYSIGNFPSTVAGLLRQALPWTIGLLAVTTLLSWVLGSILGAVVGWRGRKARFSRLLVPVSLILYSIPYYILAIILVFLFASYWRIFPMSGGHTVGAQPALTPDFVVDVLHHSVLPGLSIVVVSLGWWFLSMRSMIISQKGEDYITFAEAKGLEGGQIMWGYAFRNALLPQVTGLTISLSNIVGGALVTEVIFAYPGVGWLLFHAIKSLDFPVIQGGVLLIIVSVATANFIIDLAYPLLDPRIRYQREGSG